MKTPFDYFNGCTKGEFTTSNGKLDWRIEDGVICFQPSNGLTDWLKNLLVFPVPILIRCYLVIVPLGLALDLPELFRILKAHPEIKRAAGYSRGGMEAVITALKLKTVCITFGCPNLFWRPSKKLKLFLYGYVTHFENESDVVTKVPFKYSKGANIRVLGGKEYQPCVDDVMDFVRRESGHSPGEYRFRLEGVEW